MKKLFLYILLCVLCCLTSCSEEELNGNGILALSVKMGASVPSTTRTLPTLDELNNGCVVKLRNSDSKLIRSFFRRLSAVPRTKESALYLQV